MQTSYEINSMPVAIQDIIHQTREKFFAKLAQLQDTRLQQIISSLSAIDNFALNRLFATSDYATSVIMNNPYFLLLFFAQNNLDAKNYIIELVETYNLNTNPNKQKNQNEQSILNNQKTQKGNGALADFLYIILQEVFFEDTSAQKTSAIAESFIENWSSFLQAEAIFKTGMALKASATNEEDLMRKLRIWRAFFQTRLIWRDTNFLQDIWQTTKDISNFAKVCLQISWQFLVETYSERWGRAYTQAGEPMDLVILAMGKLGGYELNLSSDIDLIFTYSEQGFTKGGKKDKDFHTYFTQMAQKLIALLDTVTQDGFVFRIDMRLRPYGDSGALVQSFTALLNYYQEQGRDWERYAMLKASVFNGEEQGAILMQELRPFVYRKYLDYGAIEALRKMKAMISSEVNRKNLQENIKLGTGGIREIEFIVQVWQLIKGGKLQELQTQKIREALPMLANLDILSSEDAAALLDSYVFLRNLEHSIQQLQDMQTQNLPKDEVSKTRMALRMGFADLQSMLEELQQKRSVVSKIFAEIISTSEDAQKIDTRWSEIWQGLKDESLQDFMQKAGFIEYETSLNFLENLRTSKAIINMQGVGRKRLDDFMPLLLAEVAKTQTPDLVLQVSCRLVEAVLRRTAYLVLLTENPSALQQLVKICAASSKLVDRLAQMPVLLDELLTPSTLYSPADKSALESELTQALLRSDKDDDEDFIQIINYFRQSNFLRVAASDLVAQRHIMKVSDYLTFIAEVVLNQVMLQSWHYLTKRFGLPNALEEQEKVGGFLIVGYGKLGGIEMNYTSDLDLVFLHDAKSGYTDTSGKKQLDNLSFYTRLGQRLIHLLTATTPNGKLYEVDMRLRPSGNSGLLVSSLEAFKTYQEKSAWLWEHQALVKARVICGDAQLAQKFEQERLAILRNQRDLVDLKTQILAMRKKMQENLTRTELLQIKHSSGGMIDIEFLAQFCVLAYSYKFERIAVFTDVMRILDEVAESGVKPVEEVRFLQESYLLYRQESHRDSLSDITQTLDFTEQKREVIKIWEEWLKI